MKIRRATAAGAACAVALTTALTIALTTGLTIALTTGLTTGAAYPAAGATAPRAADAANRVVHVLNRNYALLSSRGLPSGAEQAHARLLDEVGSVPRAIRGYFHVGPIVTTADSGHQLTWTALADQACLSWSVGGALTRVAGPCTAADAIQLRTPLRAAGAVLGFGIHEQARDSGMDGLVMALHVGQIAFVSGALAPPGGTVDGVVDGDGDRLDDDGRVELGDAGHHVCVQLPARPRGRTRLLPQHCSRLAPRSTHWMLGWGFETYVHRMGTRLASRLRAYSAHATTPYGAFRAADVDAIRDVVPGVDLTLTRRGPARYRLESPRHCSVVLSADPAGTGTAVHVSVGVCE
jgi:hypothetical protein